MNRQANTGRTGQMPPCGIRNLHRRTVYLLYVPWPGIPFFVPELGTMNK